MKKQNIVISLSLENSSDWESLRQNCKFLTQWGRKILFSGLSPYAKSVVIEPFYICKDHRNLFSNFYSKKFVENFKYTERLHFFTKEKVEPARLMLCPDDYLDSYIGYTVIRPVNERCIGRSIFDPFKINPDCLQNYYVLRTNFKTHINSGSLSVMGYPYTSQDTDVTVCSHSALWGGVSLFI